MVHVLHSHPKSFIEISAKSQQVVGRAGHTDHLLTWGFSLCSRAGRLKPFDWMLGRPGRMGKVRGWGNITVGLKKGTCQTRSQLLGRRWSPGTEAEERKALSPLCRAQAVRHTERKLAARERPWTNFFPLVNQRRAVMGARLA